MEKKQTMCTDCSISMAEYEDLEAIYQLMEYARIENQKNAFFCADNKEYISAHLTNREKGFVLKAVCQKQLAGFFIIHIPHQDENNMGLYRNLCGEELEKVAHFESTVVSPLFRGRHIMDAFLTKAEEILQEMPYIYYFATVHPDNTYSFSQLRGHGFEILLTTEKYGGLPRHVMYKMKEN